MTSPRQNPETETQPGSTRDVLSIRDFRLVFVSSFVSNIGRWMQQVVLGVVAWELTESAAFTTQVIFAQFSPMLFLAVIGGIVADSVNRKTLLIVTQLWQAAWSIVLAVMLLDGDVGRWSLLIVVFLTGIGHAFYGPAFSAVLPTLVGRKNLPAAISLNSTQINASRVVGPAIGAWLAFATSPSTVFVVDAISYLLVVAAVAVVTLPVMAAPTGSAITRIVSGLHIARSVSQVGVPLLVMATFVLFCLPFVGLMPVIAEINLGIDAASQTYGLLYACFGLGALVGAISVGTVLLEVSKQLVVRSALFLFALSLTAFVLARSPTAAFPAVFAVGLFYFVMPTALTTFLQEHLADEIRGRIMALWMIAFGGMVPITNLISGPLADRTSPTAVCLAGVVWAIGLAAFVRLKPGPIVGEDGRPVSEPTHSNAT